MECNAAEHPKGCTLCEIWARMPYMKRWSTPTTVQDTEGALVVGFWVRKRHDARPYLCERHATILAILDQQEEQRIEAERKAQEPPPPIPYAVPRIIQTPLSTPTPIPPIIPDLLFHKPPPLPAEPFKIGPGPLTNENSVTEQPPLPVTDDILGPYRAKPGTPEGALEAAKMPAVEGGKVTYPCPMCGEQVATGDVHAC